MRAIRLCFFFVFGLVLGSVSVAAFAATPLPGATPSMNFNYPGGINAPRRAGGPIYDFPDAPGGWGKMRDINKMSIGGRTWDFIGTRNFAPRALASAGIGLAKRAGPLGIAMTLAPLIWDEVSERWLVPEESGYEGPGFTVSSSLGKGSGYAVSESCVWAPRDAALAAGIVGMSAPTLQSAYDQVYAAMPQSIVCQNTSGQPVTMTKGAKSAATTTPHVHYFWAGNNWYVTWSYESATSCPAGQVRSSSTGECVFPGPQPADDQAIEDAIYVELVARGMGSELARRLIEAGYTPFVDSVEATGPSSIPGGTTSSTTNGPAGITTTTTNNTYDITYNTNTTNNTTTVTITNNSTTTTTSPDGTTTTTTTTESPPSGSTAPQTPPEEQKQLCDEFPEASACQKLDVPVDEPPQQEEVTVTFNPSGGFGGSGSCPAPYSFSVQGRSFSIDYQPFCNFFIAVRPVVVSIAFITAMLIALGGYKRD